jgi:helicase required for RNAi-mediated heterochromatin assembly 1
LDKQAAISIIRDHVFAPLQAHETQQTWRNHPELPTGQELNPDWTSMLEQVQRELKENDVTQPYFDKDKYLETHYRLQREAGIAHLRSSVFRFKSDPAMHDDEWTAVYTQV